jgi:RNA polymerase sigma factor (sigma-70 family)
MGRQIVQTQWTYIGCDPRAERVVENLWENLQPFLESRLAAAAESVDLRAVVEHDPDSEGWLFHAALLSPDWVVVADAAASDLKHAFNKGFARLVERVDKKIEQPEVIVRQRHGLHAVIPFLVRFRETGRSNAFFAFLTPIVRSLRGHVRRELHVLQAEELISGTAPLVEELLDEITLRAWERFDKRPKNLSLDGWLIRLIDETLHELASGQAWSSLEEPVRTPSVQPEDDPTADAWIDEVDAPEMVELGDLFEGHPGADVWDSLEDGAKQAGLRRLLTALPRDQRQALVLNAVEGFEIAEIADIQDRSEQEVKIDLDEARKTLSHELASSDFWEVQEKIERTDSRDKRRRHR